MGFSLSGEFPAFVVRVSLKDLWKSSNINGLQAASKAFILKRNVDPMLGFVLLYFIVNMLIDYCFVFGEYIIIVLCQIEQ